MLLHSFSDAYDVLTASGIYGSGHVPSEALYEMVRVVKPGKVIITLSVTIFSILLNDLN